MLINYRFCLNLYMHVIIAAYWFFFCDGMYGNNCVQTFRLWSYQLFFFNVIIFIVMLSKECEWVGKECLMIRVHCCGDWKWVQREKIISTAFTEEMWEVFVFFGSKGVYIMNIIKQKLIGRPVCAGGTDDRACSAHFTFRFVIWNGRSWAGPRVLV